MKILPKFLTVGRGRIVPWTKHMADWVQCDRCPLGKTAQNRCLARGQIPAQVLIFGEAPGTREDSVGYPFVGPSGDLLNTILDTVQQSIPFTYCIGNVVGCIPHGQPGSGQTVRPPTPPEADACYPRVVDLIRLVNPRATIYCGRTAEGLLAPKLTEYFRTLGVDMPTLFVYHPAFLLRNGGESSPYFRPLVKKIIGFLKASLKKGSKNG